MMDLDDALMCLAIFTGKMTGSDTTDARTPLPRHRPDQPQEEDERERDAFDLEYHDNSDFDAYVAVMNEIEHLVPDSQEAKRKRAVVWEIGVSRRVRNYYRISFAGSHDRAG